MEHTFANGQCSNSQLTEFEEGITMTIKVERSQLGVRLIETTDTCSDADPFVALVYSVVMPDGEVLYAGPDSKQAVAVFERAAIARFRG